MNYHVFIIGEDTLGLRYVTSFDTIQKAKTFCSNFIQVYPKAVCHIARSHFVMKACVVEEPVVCSY